MKRVDKINYYLDIAQTVAARGTCLRRNFGAIIVKNDEIISTGYVGAPRGRQNCCDLGYCTREKLNVPRGERYELCRSVHAEANAIISAPRSEMIGSTGGSGVQGRQLCHQRQPLCDVQTTDYQCRHRKGGRAGHCHHLPSDRRL